MNTILQTLLRSVIERAIQQLLSADWVKIEVAIMRYLDEDLPGKEKRELVMHDLRGLGVNWATFILGAGVDILYGQLTKQPLVKETK